MHFTATINIKASPDKLWAILTDAAGYPTWEPGVISIEGRIAPGQRIVARNKIAPDRTFPAKVTAFEAGRFMAWTGGMPLGLFKGVRTFTLDPQADGSVTYTLREEFSGPMLGMIAPSLPDQTASFQAHVEGLKAFAERA